MATSVAHASPCADTKSALVMSTASPKDMDRQSRLTWRRRQNRDAMRKYRIKKQHERQEMVTLLQSLERKVQSLAKQRGVSPQQLLLQSAASAESASPSAVRCLNARLTEIHQTVFELREENVWLTDELARYQRVAQAIGEHLARDNAIPSSVNDSMGAHFAWVNSVLPALPSFYTETEANALLRQAQTDVVNALDGVSMTAPASQVLGWSDVRTFQRDRLDFLFSKEFAAHRMHMFAEQTWRVVSNVQSDPRVYFLSNARHIRLLRRINEDALLVARNMANLPCEASGPTVVSVYIVFRVKAPDGYVIGVRSLTPHGSLDAAQECHDMAYVDMSYCMMLTRLPSPDVQMDKARCHVRCGGYLKGSTPKYLDAYAGRSLLAVLRWENHCVGPIYSLER